jgi:LPXTG-site transpeptidase (sortase) family protein
MDFFTTLANPESPPKDLIALAIGLLLGISLVLFIRSRQAWTKRQAFGYNVYTATRQRVRLGRLSLFALAATALIGGAYLARDMLSVPGAEETPSEGAGAPAEVETILLIPRLAVETTMIEIPFVGQQWDISRLKDEAAHLEGTAYPGEPGNVVLAGHITIPDAGWGPFKDLHTLTPGDRVFIEHGAATYVYVVSEVKEVAPTDVQVAYPTADNRLTLITCSGWSDILEDYTHRVVVVAEMLE